MHFRLPTLITGHHEHIHSHPGAIQQSRFTYNHVFKECKETEGPGGNPCDKVRTCKTLDNRVTKAQGQTRNPRTPQLAWRKSRNGRRPRKINSVNSKQHRFQTCQREDTDSPVLHICYGDSESRTIPKQAYGKSRL